MMLSQASGAILFCRSDKSVQVNSRKKPNKSHNPSHRIVFTNPEQVI
jgi:hypothetical protein